MTDTAPETCRLHHPLDSAEQLQIRKELREAERVAKKQKDENRQVAKKLFSEQIHAHRVIALGSSVEYGKIYVRFMFLLNGGAMVALLTLAGAFVGKSSFPLPVQVVKLSHLVLGAFYWYIGGLIATASTASLGYIHWAVAYGTHLNEAQTSLIVEGEDLFSGQDRNEELAQFQRSDRWHNITFWAAIVVGAIALACFIVASFKIALALQRLNS